MFLLYDCFGLKQNRFPVLKYAKKQGFLHTVFASSSIVVHVTRTREWIYAVCAVPRILTWIGSAFINIYWKENYLIISFIKDSYLTKISILHASIKKLDTSSPKQNLISLIYNKNKRPKLKGDIVHLSNISYEFDQINFMVQIQIILTIKKSTFMSCSKRLFKFFCTYLYLVNIKPLVVLSEQTFTQVSAFLTQGW